MNPHQTATAVDNRAARVLNGAPSLINWLDALNAWQLVAEARAVTGAVTAASFKHVSPAGVATAGPVDAEARRSWSLAGDLSDVTSAYVRSRDCDPKSSYGDMIAISDVVDVELANVLAGVVSDGVIAPGFASGALDVLARKKQGTFLVVEADPSFDPPAVESRDLFGATFEQQRDTAPITAELLGAADVPVLDALLAMVTLRYTQSNSVVLAKDGATLGIGAGQQNRVDCVRLAAAKAATWWLRRHPAIGGLPDVAGMSRQDRLNWQIRLADPHGDGMTSRQESQFTELFGDVDVDADSRDGWLAQLSGVTLASDGFLPFRDNIDFASTVGVRYVIEPGGSTRSGEISEACAEYGMTHVKTGLRLFHH